VSTARHCWATKPVQPKLDDLFALPNAII